MLERRRSVLQYYNNIASLQDWYSTDDGSHPTLHYKMTETKSTETDSFQR